MYITLIPMIALGLFALTAPFIAGRRIEHNRSQLPKPEPQPRATAVITDASSSMAGYVADPIPASDDFFTADPLGSLSLPTFLEAAPIANDVTLDFIGAGKLPDPTLPVDARWIPWGYDLSETDSQTQVIPVHIQEQLPFLEAELVAV